METYFSKNFSLLILSINSGLYLSQLSSPPLRSIQHYIQTETLIIMKLNSEQTKKVISFYYTYKKSPTETARHFNHWAAMNDCVVRISKKNVIDAVKRFESNTTLHHVVQSRPPMSRDDGILLGVLNSLYMKPGSSIRTSAAENGLSVRTTHKIARDVLKLQPYRLGLAQKLTEYDKMVRVDASHQLLPIVDSYDRVIIYSDEASFRTDGHVNRWNCYLWDYSRPDDFFAEEDQGAGRVTIWAGVSHDHIFGPYFFPSTVTADSYEAMLTEIFLPDLLQRFPTTDGLWFQQDGAPAHTAHSPKVMLESNFGIRVISKGFSHEWPPRSPDLTPCDFYLWSAVSELVYATGSYSSTAELRDALVAAFNTLRQSHMDHVKAAVLSVPQRLRDCIALNGCQLHHR